MKLLLPRFHVSIFNILGDISGAGQKSGPRARRALPRPGSAGGGWLLSYKLILRYQGNILPPGTISKNSETSELLEVENWGEKTRFWGLGGKGGIGGGRHLCRGHSAESQQNFSSPGLKSKNVIVFELCFPQILTESRKVWNLKCCPIRKIFFSSFFLDQVEPKSEKKKKWKFWKVRTFPPPGSAQQGPRADALGNSN